MDLYNEFRQRSLKEMFNTSDIISVGDSLIKNTLAGKNPGVPKFMVFHSEHGGVGKTTVGRIIAKELNPDAAEHEVEAIFKGDKSPFFYEINGGNFRKIDDARAFEAKILYQRDMVVPFNIVYMINEAHKLTPDAQEVFLQMTENLPPHIFIIFTLTVIENMNEKLMSRAKLYKFKSVDRSDMRKLLVDIAGRVGAGSIPEYVTDQLYDQYGSSIRRCINELESYLSTGKVAGIDAKDSEPAYFGEVITLLLKLADGEKISWSKSIAPKLNSIMDMVSPEEAKLKFNWRMYYLMMSPSGVSVKHMKLLSIMSEELKVPGYLPPKIDLVGALFRCYDKAREIGLSQNKEADRSADTKK